MRFALCLSAVVLLGMVRTTGTPPQPLEPKTELGLVVPDGFTVSEYAVADLANDIYTMTTDDRGRIIVSGRGYIRILEDTNNDGKADKAIPFADSPKDGAMGMLWEKGKLFVTGDGGLRVFTDADGDDKADGPSKLIRKMRTGSEHDAHAIRRGPDGWLYVLCGNNSQITKDHADLPTSPIKEPTAGTVLRFSPKDYKCEIVADGFRNAYGMDFNPDGELFTYDSDNERCVGLPWYEHTRLYHVMPGRHYGWMTPQHGFYWRCPPYFPDVPPPVATLNRGSPTGVACYRHVQFPDAYHGGIFALDWTFGIVYFVALEKAGSTYESTSMIFMHSTGENGFAPTGVVVHPKTGDLYVSIGGRGTRGAVYRIRYTKEKREIDPEAVARLQPKQRSLAMPRGFIIHHDELNAPNELKRAQLLLRFQHKLDDDVVLRNLTRKTQDPNLIQTMAAVIAARDKTFQNALLNERKFPVSPIILGYGLHQSQPEKTLQIAAKLLRTKMSESDSMHGIRLVQLAFGDLNARKYKSHVYEGYSLRNYSDELAKKYDLAETVLQYFPSGNADLDRELSRTMAAMRVDDPKAVRLVGEQLAKATDPVQAIHYLIVLSRLPGPLENRLRGTVVDRLITLRDDVDKHDYTRDRHWPMRVKELVNELQKKDPGIFPDMLKHNSFGRDWHGLYAECPGFDRPAAARIFLKKAATDNAFDWNAETLRILQALPAKDSFPVFRSQWDNAGLRSLVLSTLAKQPQVVDRQKFVTGMKSLNTAQVSLKAWQQVVQQPTAEELVGLVQLLSRAEKEKAKALQQETAQVLDKLTKQKHGADVDAWRAWLRTAHPDAAKKLDNVDGVDLAAWNRRLRDVDWSAGDSKAGKKLFTKAGCAACHSGGRALGPDLRGLTKRFSRGDVMLALLQPNRDVSPRYQATLIETAEGKLYQGQVIYQAVDGVILQTDAATTVRIPGDQIVSQQSVPLSLMPAGLLNELTDAQIVDLWSYLRGM